MQGMITSALTERSQTTLPGAIRAVLGLTTGEDRVGYIVEGNEVRLVNASAGQHEDPVLDKFLAFLATDMEANPRRITGFPASLLERMAEVTEGVEIDHGAEIEGDTAL